MSWFVDTSSGTPPSAQLVEQALDRIAAGILGSGDRLPSVRALAAEARVNPNTAARAWRELEHLGVARGENGRGVFVTDEGPRIAIELRRASTLTALARAARDALRAGHPPDVVRRVLEENCRDTDTTEQQRRSA